jgi:hypothetical protein
LPDRDEVLTPSAEALRFEAVQVLASARPSLLVVVDTEEEFDWHAPFSRANTSVAAMRHVGRIDGVFAPYNVTPTYVVDSRLPPRGTAISR